MKRILVIDDDEATRVAIRNAFGRRYEVVEAGSGQEAFAQFETEHPDLVICDIILPDIDGLKLMNRLKDRAPSMPIVLISGGGRIGANDYLRIGTALGAQKCLGKPLRVRELQDAVDVLLGASPA